MPKLGDYLGQLVSEITIARLQADLEAVRVAELYASHPLLKNLPVPRFRLPDIEITVPVIIKEAEEIPAGAPARGGLDQKNIKTAFDRAFKKEIQKSKITLTAPQAKKLDFQLRETMKTLERSAEVAVDTNEMAEALSKEVMKNITLLKKPRGEKEIAQLRAVEKSMAAGARLELLKLRAPPPRLSALVTTQEIREAGGTENLTHLKLKISEDAFEWAEVEKDGEKVNRLVPE